MRGSQVKLVDCDVRTAKFEPLKPHTQQPDDAADSLLQHCAAALISVSNRALCPKELAELCMKRGWSCSGSQPFAIISSVIRAHLRRRQISTSNASNGLPPAPGMPPPLFVSYELTGPVAPEDVEAIGIIRDEKPAIKRGTLWYLSYHGTGFPTPFAPGRDPVGHLKNMTHSVAPAPTAASHPAAPMSPDRMPTRRGPRHSFSYAPITHDYDDLDSMGRGKRKRRASAAVGGEWESIALPSTAAGHNGAPAMTIAAPLPRPALPRISEEGPRPVVTSPGPIVKIKLKLPALSEVKTAPPAPAVSPARIATLDAVIAPPSSDDDTADEMEEDGWARRKKQRYSMSKGGYRTPRPSFSASTSVFGDDSTDEDEEKVSRKDQQEAINRAADFDFEFNHSFSIPAPDSLEELGLLAIDSAAGSSSATTPRFEDTPPLPMPQADLEAALETALKATQPQPSIKVDEEADDAVASGESDEGATSAKGKERKRAASAGALDAPPNINATLCPARPASHRARSHSYEGLPTLSKRAVSEGPPDLHIEQRSPAGPLPVLSVDNQAIVFASVSLQPTPPLLEDEPPCQTPYAMPEQAFDLRWREEIDSHATSPSAIALSPPSLSEEGADYFDAEAGSRLSRSVSPFHALDEDIYDDANDYLSDSMMVSMDLDLPEAAGLELLDAEFGGEEVLSSIAPPSLEQAATFFTSFLGGASVPVSVVGIQRGHESSSEDVETEDSEEEIPPARNTRAAARARQLSTSSTTTPAPAPRKQGRRRAAAA